MGTEMKSELHDKMKFIEDFCVPAIAEHQEKGVSTIKHPISGDTLKVDRNDEAGFVVVYTEADGILYRVNFKAKKE